MKTLVLFLLSISPALAQPDEYTLHHYAAECERELGAIPAFRCGDGEPVPVFDSDRGIEVTDATHAGRDTKCDRPSLLRRDWLNRVSGFNPCVPYTRLGRSAAQTGFPTEWIWSCRRYFVRGRQDPKFDDINMIGHNPTTGATCFFVSRINRTSPTPAGDPGLDGTSVPSASTAEGLRFWKSPKEMDGVPAILGGSERCVECHDNDAFVHTPFIRQVKRDGKPLVPSHPDGPYFVVGTRYFSSPGWRLRHLVSPEARACTSCHRIGDRRSCDDFALMAVGLQGHGSLTRAFSDAAWMPAYHDDWGPEPGRKPAKRFLDAATFINECCKRPTDPKCKWESVPR